MQNALKLALASALNGSCSLADGALLLANGCPVDAVAKCPGEMSSLVKGELLPPAALLSLVANGVDVQKFLGIRKMPTLPVTTPANADETATVRVPTDPTPNGNATSQEVTIHNDPFAFILKQKVDTHVQKRALTSLYNSMVSRAQTKVVEGYKHSLRQKGVQIDEKDLAESMKATRSEIGLDKMLDSVLSKKGFVISREEQDNLLVETLRDNLSLCGIGYSDEVHLAALADGRAFSRTFSDRCVNGLKARGLTFAS